MNILENMKVTSFANFLKRSDDIYDYEDFFF